MRKIFFFNFKVSLSEKNEEKKRLFHKSSNFELLVIEIIVVKVRVVVIVVDYEMLLIIRLKSIFYI
jgi:hypothetical protein